MRNISKTLEELNNELGDLCNETPTQDITADFPKQKLATPLLSNHSAKPPKGPQRTPQKLMKYEPLCEPKLPKIKRERGWFKSCSKPKICKKGNSFEFKFKALRNQASLAVKVKIPCSFSQNDAEEEHLPFIQSPSYGSWGFLSPLPSLKEQARHIDTIMHRQMMQLPTPMSHSHKYLPHTMLESPSFFNSRASTRFDML